MALVKFPEKYEPCNLTARFAGNFNFLGLSQILADAYCRHAEHRPLLALELVSQNWNAHYY